MKFKREFMQQVVWDDEPTAKLEKETIVNIRRWSIVYKIIFQYLPTGKFYQSLYSKGATECQPEEPYEYSTNEIECTEVHQVEKLVKVWESV